LNQAQRATNSDNKYRLWRLAGGVSLIIGLIGMAIPILPTTPFILVAAYGFTRGSRKIYRWVVDPNSLGTGFAEWRRRGVIPPFGGLMIMVVMLIGLVLALVSGLETTSLIIELVGLLLVGAYLLTRPKAGFEDSDKDDKAP